MGMGAKIFNPKLNSGFFKNWAITPEKITKKNEQNIPPTNRILLILETISLPCSSVNFGKKKEYTDGSPAEKMTTNMEYT